MNPVLHVHAYCTLHTRVLYITQKTIHIYSHKRNCSKHRKRLLMTSISLDVLHLPTTLQLIQNYTANSMHSIADTYTLKKRSLKIIAVTRGVLS